MSEKRFNPSSLILAGGTVVLLVLALVLHLHRQPAPAPVAPQNAPPQVAAAPATEAVVHTPTVTAPAATTRQAVQPPAAVTSHVEGSAVANGTTVTRDGDTIHIVGTAELDDFNHWNGIKTDMAPEGDFTASVDFKVADFSGPGVRLVYLRAGQHDSDAVGIYFYPGNNYRVQSWTPASQAGSLRPFGDEAKVFHRFTLQYDTAAQTATGWVDDKLVGRIKAPLTGAGSFWMVTNTQSAGATMDVTFQNFTLVHGLKEATPAAATPATPTPRPVNPPRDLP